MGWFQNTGLGSLLYKGRDLVKDGYKAGYNAITSDPGAAQEKDRKALLYGQAGAAGTFADQSQGGYNQLGQQGQGALAGLQRVAQGQDSVSAEQLRQALQQNQAAQMSMAAGAAPANAAMAARTAALQSARLGSGLAGQQAIAGLQERQQAQNQYAQLLQGLRGQDLQATQGARGQAIQGYGAGNAGAPEKSWIDKWGPTFLAGGQIAATASDRRLKTDIKNGDAAAAQATASLQPYTYQYRDQRYGAGPQLGVMAQDLERAGLGQAVVNTPEGKLIDPGKLTTANTGLIAALARRVDAIENADPADMAQRLLNRRRAALAGSNTWRSPDPGADAAQLKLGQRRAALRSRQFPPDASGGETGDLGGQ